MKVCKKLDGGWAIYYNNLKLGVVFKYSGIVLLKTSAATAVRIDGSVSEHQSLWYSMNPKDVIDHTYPAACVCLEGCGALCE